MEKDDEFLHTFFSHVSQLCFEKSKEHVEKEKEACKSSQTSPWLSFLNLLPQISLAEKSYMDIGFLQNKNKGFLRKDNSLKSIYETLKNDFKRLDDAIKSNVLDKRIQTYCQNIHQFLTARVSLIDLYDKIFQSASNKQLKYSEILVQIELIIQKQALCFTDISLTPIKAIFNFECEILEQLFKALTELQKLQFLSSLALIYGAHTRLAAWESKMQNRETWKLGFLKNNPLPTLFQWLQKLKGVVLSKFSLYFHNTLAQQTTPNDMRQLCTKLQIDHYQKMVHFQKKYDAAYVILLSATPSEGVGYDAFPIIVSYPPRCPPQHENIIKMISTTTNDFNDKIVYKFSTQEQRTYIITTVELNIYLVVLFESKKSEKDVYIENFVTELCTNLRCTKVFASLKNTSK